MKGIYARFTGKPNPVLYPSTAQSSNNDIGKSVMGAVGAAEDRPMVVAKHVRATINFASTLTQERTDVEVDVAGAALGDQVLVSCVTPLASDCEVTGFVSEANVVKARFNNYSSDTINPASAEYVITVIPVPQT
jgi:hypothetical protein